MKVRRTLRVHREGCGEPLDTGAAAAGTCVPWARALSSSAARAARTPCRLPAVEAGRARGASFCPQLYPDLCKSQSPGSRATSGGTRSLASCPALALPAAGSRLSWAPESGLPVELLLGLADGQDGLVQGPQPPRLLPTPRARALTAWEGQQPAAAPGAQGDTGRKGTGESKVSLDVQGAGVRGPGATPSSPAPQEGSPAAKMPSSSSDSSGQDSGVEPLLSVAWLWPEGWSLALRSRQSGPGPWTEMAPLRTGAHPRPPRP